MKSHWSVPASLLLLILSSGCVLPPFAVPLPSVSPKSGTPLKSADMKFIKAGKTARSEIVERLGTRYRETDGKTAMAYSWDAGGFSVDWVVGFINQVDESRGTMGLSSWRAVFIDFDSDGVVQHVSRVRLSSSKSLDTQLQEWARANQRKSSKTHRPSSNTNIQP